MYKKYIKRLLDILISATALIILLPILLIVAILVKTKLGSPVLFKQERPGKNGEIFAMYKFRSMTSETDEEGNLLPDDIRLNAFGKRLRSTSLDELPSLINILKGQMSLVGPRPLLVSYLPLYNKEQARRHDMRPGLTGWAQVNGRNLLNWTERFEKDVYYIDHCTFLLDVKILMLTVKKVFAKEGIDQENGVTMDDFTGEN